MNDKEDYYFISYAWRLNETWEQRKEKLKEGIIPNEDNWNFSDQCIKIHPFIWISHERTCQGNPSNKSVSLLNYYKITKNDYNIWRSTEHRNHY